MIHRVLIREFLSIIKKTEVKPHYTQIRITRITKKKKKKRVNRGFKRPITINIKTNEPT